MRLLAILVVLVACGDDDAMPLCFTEAGRGVAEGAVDPDDPCRVCDARTAQLRPRWARGCGTEEVIEDDGLAVGFPELGPDADGDGIGDVLLYGAIADGERCFELRSVGTRGIVATIAEPRAPIHPDARRLGPDATGDGLADILLGSPRAYGDLGDELDLFTAGLRPDPGRVVLYSPALDEVVHEWIGESDCRALGYWVDLGPDVDGDGLADPMLSDPGCVEIEETPDGPTTAGSFGGHVTIYSGASDEVIQRWSAPEGMSGFGNHGRFVPDQNGDGIEDVVLYLTPDRGPDVADQVWLLDPVSGETIRTWRWERGDEPFAYLRHQWLGYDLTGDGEMDAVGRLNATEVGGPLPRPVGVLPSLDRPVGSLTVYGNDISPDALHIVPDVDGDGADDVLFGDPESGELRLLNAWNEVLWSVDYDEPQMFPQVSRGFDVDNDGLVDFATIDDGDFVSVRVFLSRGLP